MATSPTKLDEKEAQKQAILTTQEKKSHLAVSCKNLSMFHKI